MTWKRETDALTPVAGTNISDSNIVERPKGTSIIHAFKILKVTSFPISDLQQEGKRYYSSSEPNFCLTECNRTTNT